jgi:1-acyl-sn-glycerol-3-phosphate acyltransferase
MLLKTGLRTTAREFLRIVLGIYFSRIERFHVERVPLSGPVLFASNHPGSITDAFLVGVTVPRPVSFVGTVQLFRFKPIAWLLRACNIIPVNRVKDDPRAMRTVMETFEACYRVMEQGGAVGIFPEGITYNDAGMRPVKSGAARMALELENRHKGKLGLRIVPLGLTYSGKERYRSDVLVHFGEPLVVATFLDGYDSHRKERIHELSAEIERRIQALILHLPALEQARLLRSVTRLYLERLKVGGWVVTEATTPRAEELVLTQTIAGAIDHFSRTDPDRVKRFGLRLARYEKRLRRLGLEDEAVGQLSGNARGPIASAWQVTLTLAGLPVAIHGWLHRWLPALVVRWGVRRFTARGARKAQTPHVSMIMGLAVFGIAYALYVGVVHLTWGWPASLIYGLSLPVAGLYAHAYSERLRRLPLGMRTLVIRLRAPFVVGSLVRQRASLINEIEAARQDYVSSHGAG